MGLFGSLALLADFFFRRRRLKEREGGIKEGGEGGRERRRKGEKEKGREGERERRIA